MPKPAMDFTAARKLLAGPLRFGDPDLIAARELIETLEACKAAIRACTHDPEEQECGDCDGEGECSHCHAACETCDGTGKDPDCDDPCDCLSGFEYFVLQQAKHEIKTKGRKAA